MAVVPYTAVKSPNNNNTAIVVNWPSMAVGDTGKPIEMPMFSDRSVQVSGTIGGTAVTIEGSNNGTVWAGLTDTGGVAISFAAAGIKQILQCTRYIRPVCTGGTPSVNVDLLIVGK